MVESVKAASDLYCPLSGKGIEVNPALERDPEVINRDPYGEGWIFRLRPDNPADLERLLDADEYAATLAVQK